MIHKPNSYLLDLKWMLSNQRFERDKVLYNKVLYSQASSNTVIILLDSYFLCEQIKLRYQAIPGSNPGRDYWVLLAQW